LTSTCFDDSLPEDASSEATCAASPKERLLKELEADRSIRADRVLDILTSLYLSRGVPKHIRRENGYAKSSFTRLWNELLSVEDFVNLPEAR